MTLQELESKVGDWAISKGWDFPLANIPEKLMLVVTELSEAMEEYRTIGPIDTLAVTRYEEDGKPIGFASELADAIIRILHISYRLGIDIEYELNAKMQYNRIREYRHGGRHA